MPLAGKPPFATDEPDSYYDSRQTERRQPPPKHLNPNDRTSAYDMYDSYLGNNPSANRQSGMGAMGMDFLNGEVDDEDDDDDRPRRQAGPLPSKHEALAAATGVARPREHAPAPPAYNAAPIAAPRPGYAAPIDALNNLSKPEPVAQPHSRQMPPQHLRINPNAPLFPQPNSQQRPVYSSPSPISSTPHPLHPPISPITPVFARPQGDVKFAIPRTKPIMRGDSEETLIPKRGDAGDDFWRRFSIVAKEEGRKPSTEKKSAWLKKTEGGKTAFSRWIWIIGVILVLCAAGGIGLGVYLSQIDDSLDAPVAIGGSAEQGTKGLSQVGSATASVKTSIRVVAATNVVDRRDAHEPRITPISHIIRRSHRH